MLKNESNEPTIILYATISMLIDGAPFEKNSLPYKIEHPLKYTNP